MKDSWIEFFIIAIIFILWLGFRSWQADGDTRCFFAHDPATCATIKNK